MKKILLSTLFTALTLTSFVSCSSDDGGSAPVEQNDFTNAEYIKSLMIGKWQFKAHFSDYWVNTTGNSYYIFNKDNSYSYKSILNSEPVEEGSYTIDPATKDDNAVLKMINKKGQGSRLILLSINGNIAEVQNTFFKERYEKQQ